MTTSSDDDNLLDSKLLLDSAARLLYDFLIKSSRSDAKKRFKQLLQSEPFFVAEIQRDGGSNLNVMLKLDYSEFRGELLFGNFKLYLSQLIEHMGKAVESKEDIHLRQEVKGQRFLFGTPAALEIDGQLNVLMLSMNLGNSGEITIELLFFEPGQFKQQRQVDL